MEKCLFSFSKEISSKEKADFSEEEIKSVLGTNKSIINLYNKGYLNTSIKVSMQDQYEEIALGGKVGNSSTLSKVVKALFGIGVKYEGFCNKVEGLSVYSYEDGGIGLAVFDTYGNSFSEKFINSSEGLYLDESITKCSFSEEDKGILCKCIDKIVSFANKTVNAKLYSIEYYATKDIDVSKVGTGELYLGYSNACSYNGIQGIDSSMNEDLKDEYAVIFLEKF